MRITGVRTFVVGNPTPGYGGRYFIFLKLESDGGLEGLGEVYAATVSPHLVARMVEDVVARHVVGREPFHIEATWRDVYASGYAMRPDPTLVGVLSGIEMAMWDLAGKAVGKPVYELLGGRVRERLRAYSYLYAEPGELPVQRNGG
jgi:2-dehydro-3-deoxyphosphogalactonate aldolase